MPGSRFKILLVILLPIIVSGMVTSAITLRTASEAVEARSRYFGEAIANQLALSVTDQLVQEDLLSLNVTLNELLERGGFTFASVYSADNRLLAQAGKNSGDVVIFTEEVVFQNAGAGYVQLGLDSRYIASPSDVILSTSLSIHAGIALIIAVAVWLYADFFLLWWTAPTSSRLLKHGTKTQTEDDEEAQSEQVAGFVTILVIKVRPARQLHTWFDTIEKALTLHRAESELTNGDDILVVFRSDDQVFQSVCCGLLVRAMMKLTRGNSQVKLGMHTIEATEDTRAFEKAKKHATYLASISEGRLLTSRQVFQLAGANTDRMMLTEFHSSLTPDGEVFFVESLNPANQVLIDKQAMQLI